ncbi:MAG: extracellular solute-binding protein [Clostridia bacterium]|nr:extracellular solute-binding protein [Clostridia bacterium]
MKKLLIFLISALLILTSCSRPDGNQDSSAVQLNIINWEDYIDIGDEEAEIPSVIDGFESYYEAKYNVNLEINYSTQGTCENMYTELKLNPNHYDLVCPSEYMILKMIAEDMLEPIQRTSEINVDVYDAGVSPYISNLFKNLKVGDKLLYDYAACYMWGTMGYIYNPEYVDEEEIKHWNAIWNEDYANKCTIKDSVRDSYILAMGYVYEDELNALATELASKKESYLQGSLSKADYDKAVADYNAEITNIFNNVSQDSVNLAGKSLKSLTDSLYGYEVDSGKKDMASGKIWINFAWSGDAVYALDFAEDPEEVGDNTAELYYTVPEEGSNIFFDGWVMPKGANVAVAQEFINYVQRPDIALRNMNYIGYTTSIATDEIFEYLVGEDGYAYAEEDVTLQNGKYFVEEEGEQIEVFPVDLSYLFSRNGESYIAYTDVLGRQFTTQYPDEDTVNRCTVMRNFSDEELKRLNQMWENAKEGNMGTKGLYIAIIITLALLVIAGMILIIQKYGLFNRHGIKGYKEIEREYL